MATIEYISIAAAACVARSVIRGGGVSCKADGGHKKVAQSMQEGDTHGITKYLQSVAPAVLSTGNLCLLLAVKCSHGIRCQAEVIAVGRLVQPCNTFGSHRK